MIFCVIIIFGYIFLQVLHSGNFWESIGISPPPDQMEPFSSLGMIFFQVILVGGWSLVTGIIVWQIISRIFSPSHPLIRLFFEICQAWISLSVFEVSLIIYNDLLSSIVTGFVYVYPLVIDYQLILNIGWINLVLICLFYTVIGLQALRKRLEMERFLGRVAYDVGQALIMSFEGVFLFLPFGLLDFVLIPENFRNLLLLILAFGYYTVFVILLIEYSWWIGRRIEREKEQSQTDLNSQILLLRISLILLPLMCLISLFPFPFFLILMAPWLWFLLFLAIIFLSIIGVLLHGLLKILTPGLYENVEQRMQYMKYYFEFLLASRGTMFNYPQPIDILSEGTLTRVISGRWEKVTLKMACGHCYHVFETETSKDGSKVKPIPCPFCRSMATTPVWE
jgi:hypothetical protein